MFFTCTIIGGACELSGYCVNFDEGQDRDMWLLPHAVYDRLDFTIQLSLVSPTLMLHPLPSPSCKHSSRSAMLCTPLSGYTYV